MEVNEMKFETAPRPLVAGKSKFPYNAVLKALQELDSTKSITMPEKECKYGNVAMLRKIASENNLPYVKHTMMGSKKGQRTVYLWMNHE